MAVATRKKQATDQVSVTLIDEYGQVDVPAWVVDLKSFVRWADTVDFPEKGRIWYLKGKVWVDMSKEQVFSHSLIKGVYTARLVDVTEQAGSGYFFPDGLFYSNEDADIGGQPDGTFVSFATLESALARLIEGKRGGYVELVGTPDMVLEIVSHSSVAKDTVVLKQAYWQAGIPEYWLVDARQEPPQFTIFRHTSRGYVAVRPKDGWLRSGVFGKSFRLVQTTSKLRLPQFKLEIR
jgi:Uma2 family endonuclease